jgi:hypothetical protein
MATALRLEPSTPWALARALPTVVRGLATLRAASFQDLMSLPVEDVVNMRLSGRRVTVTTYRDIQTDMARDVHVAVKVVAHGWLGFRCVWTQGFRATSGGMRRTLRRRELYEYAWRSAVGATAKDA